MHLLLSAPGALALLDDELRRAWPAASTEVLGDTVLTLRGAPPVDSPWPAPVFARQLLPDASFVTADSVRLWAELLLDRLTASVPEGQPWRLHAFPGYGQGTAGQHRCALLQEALGDLLHRKRRQWKRSLVTGTAPFTPAESLVQLWLRSPTTAFLSVARAPLPSTQFNLISPFPRGEVPIAVDKAAPSRAFAKLIEAEERLGTRIAAGDQCVDLGAAPGSWTYVAVHRGATVTAIDRAELRPDLMASPRVRFVRGDAFQFLPEQRVDWLLCDVIATPQRSLEQLLHWLDAGRCRRFVVTLKFRGSDDYPWLDRARRELERRVPRRLLQHLCANRNEACAAGIVE